MVLRRYDEAFVSSQKPFEKKNEVAASRGTPFFEHFVPSFSPKGPSEKMADEIKALLTLRYLIGNHIYITLYNRIKVNFIFI